MEQEDFIVELGGQKFIDVIKILPETLPSGKKIVWQEVDDCKVFISVDKHSARGRNAKPIVIKRFVPFDELLFEGLGLRFGDGIKLQGGKMKVFGFSNTNLEVHKHFLKFAKECFGLSSNEFRVVIIIPSKLFNEKENIENNVSKELNIPFKNFFKTRVLDKGNFPVIDVKISSTLLGLVINLIFENVKEILLGDKNFCASFLRGVIASEANVLVRRTGKLDEISIAAKEKTKRELIKNCLIKLGIIPNKDKETIGQESVMIHGLSNFRIVKEFDLTLLHPEKSEIFENGLKGFKKEEFRKGECKFLVLQNLLNSKLSTKELAIKLNRKSRTINDAVAFLEKKKFIKRLRNGRHIFWEITEDGLSFFKNNRSFKELRNNF